MSDRPTQNAKTPPNVVNEFELFNEEFATAVSSKLEQHISPRNESMPSADAFEDRVHEMTASYSEISMDSQSSPPFQDLLSLEASPLSSDVECGVKKKDQVLEETLPDSDSRRPDKLDLQRYTATSKLDASETKAFQKTLEDLNLEGTVTQEGDLVLFVAEDLETKIKLSSPVSKKGVSDTPPFPGSRTSTPCLYRQALMPQLPALDPNILNDLEVDVKRIATSVDTLTENLAGILHSVSAITVACLETYRDGVCKTCDAVDSNIKSMYQLMAKCEELSKSMEPIHKLADKIKGVKRLLDLFENATNP